MQLLTASFQEQLQQAFDKTDVPANFTLVQSQLMGSAVDQQNGKFADLSPVPNAATAVAVGTLTPAMVPAEPPIPV